MSIKKVINQAEMFQHILNSNKKDYLVVTAQNVSYHFANSETAVNFMIRQNLKIAWVTETKHVLNIDTKCKKPFNNACCVCRYCVAKKMNNQRSKP